MLMVTFGNPKLWGLVAKGSNDVIGGLELSMPRPDLPPGKKEGLEVGSSPVANDLISGAHVIRPPKNPRGEDLGSFGVGGHRRFGESAVLSWRGNPAPFLHSWPWASLAPGCP